MCGGGGMGMGTGKNEALSLHDVCAFGGGGVLAGGGRPAVRVGIAETRMPTWHMSV